jgi:hypothetical protein
MELGLAPEEEEAEVFALAFAGFFWSLPLFCDCWFWLDCLSDLLPPEL